MSAVGEMSDGRKDDDINCEADKAADCRIRRQGCDCQIGIAVIQPVFGQRKGLAVDKGVCHGNNHHDDKRGDDSYRDCAPRFFEQGGNHEEQGGIGVY